MSTHNSVLSNRERRCIRSNSRLTPLCSRLKWPQHCTRAHHEAEGKQPGQLSQQETEVEKGKWLRKELIWRSASKTNKMGKKRLGTILHICPVELTERGVTFTRLHLPWTSRKKLSGSLGTTEKNVKSSLACVCLRDKRTKRCRKQGVVQGRWTLHRWTCDRMPILLPRESVIGASTVGERHWASQAMLWSSDTRSSDVPRPIVAAINRFYIQCKIWTRYIFLHSDEGHNAITEPRLSLFTQDGTSLGTRHCVE